MKSKLGLAIVGASRIASRVLPFIRQVPDFDVLSVASSNIDRAVNFASEHSIKNAFGAYEDALASQDTDAVYISNMSADHFGLIQKSLEAGKHVLCEKPLVLNAQNAKDVSRLATEKGLVLLEGLMYRFHPHVSLLHDALRSGSLGVLKSMHLSFSFDLGTLGTRRGVRSVGGGALNDLGCYLVDFVTLSLARSAVGKRPRLTSVIAQAQMSSEDSESIDTDFTASLGFENGVSATLDAAIDRPASNLWELRGERGSIGVFRNDPQGVSGNGGYSTLVRIDEESRAKIDDVVDIANPMDQFRLEFQNFSDVIKGKSEPFISLEDIVANAETMDAIRSSFHIG